MRLSVKVSHVNAILYCWGNHHQCNSFRLPLNSLPDFYTMFFKGLVEEVVYCRDKFEKKEEKKKNFFFNMFNYTP